MWSSTWTWVLSCLGGHDLRQLTFLLLAQVITGSWICILNPAQGFASSSAYYSSTSNFFPGPCCRFLSSIWISNSLCKNWVLERSPNLASLHVAFSAVIPVFVFMAVLRYLKVPEVTCPWVVPVLLSLSEKRALGSNSVLKSLHWLEVSPPPRSL